MTAALSTADRILDVAESLVRTHGYGYSFADIASELSIRKASIHYHFASKQTLTRAVTARYRVAFAVRTAEVHESGLGPLAQLEKYFGFYRDALRDGDRMCLYGLLAADCVTVPAAVRDEVNAFFADQERWLARLLTAGRRDGVFSFAGSANVEALALLAGLEGGMLMARSRRDVHGFTAVVQRLVANLIR
ncbi:MAG: TetR family transcriptional regulator [Gemmatimonadota bacterium]